MNRLPPRKLSHDNWHNAAIVVTTMNTSGAPANHPQLSRQASEYTQQASAASSWLDAPNAGQTACQPESGGHPGRECSGR